MKSYRLFLVVAGLAMLCLNLLDAPTLSDDMVYRFMWSDDPEAPVRDITSVGDLLTSQWVHYLTTNGRWLVHLLAQAFLVFVPPVVLQVLNAVLFVALLHLSVRWIGVDRKYDLFLATALFFLLFVVLQGLSTTLLWSLGTFNYLWTIVATLALLLWLRRIGSGAVGCRAIWLAPLAFFVGCGHEGLSLPVSAGLFVYLIVNRRKSSTRIIALYALCYWLGTMSVLFSPGIWNRSTEGITLMNRLVSGAVNLLFNMRVAWLLLLALIILWRRRRDELVAHLRSHVVDYAALLVSVGIITLCGTNLERVCFFTDYMAMLLLLGLVAPMVGSRWRRGLMAVACGVSLLLFVPACMARRDNLQVWQHAERQMQETGREVIGTRSLSAALPGFIRSRYVNPSVTYGFYSCYMGFDASDSNMRCAAHLSGKDRLIFLPEEVLSTIAQDSLAYTRGARLVGDGSLYVWRLGRDSDVASVEFVLGPEDVSRLWPHQRLLAYRADTYALDDFHFEVVRIVGHAYLVFTRPTTNISRRMHHVRVTYK